MIHQPQCSGIEQVTMSHREQLSRPPFRLRVFLPKCGTCYGVQGKAVYGHIELIMGCLGEAKKKKKVGQGRDPGDLRRNRRGKMAR